MAIVSISRIQSRRGLRSDLPVNLAEGEFGFCLDTRQVFIGNGPGFGGNTELLTQYNPGTGLLTFNSQVISGTINNGNIYLQPVGSGNVVISNLTVTGTTNGVNENYIGPESGTVSRTMQDKAHDIVSLKDWNANGDNSTDNTIAVESADATGKLIYVPDGRYVTALSFTDATNSTYYGPGQIVLGGYGVARQRTNITSDVVIPSTNKYQYFDHGFDKVHSTQYTLVGSAVGSNANVITSVQTLDTASMQVRMYDYYGGINVSNVNITSGRTRATVDALKLYHAGQGELSAFRVTGFANSTNTNAAYIDALPKTVIYSGNITASISNTAMSGSNLVFNDNNFNVTVIGHTANYSRNGNDVSLGKVWIHDRPISTGNVAVDAAYNPSGQWNKLFDATAATLTSAQGAIVLKGGQTIYLNAQNTGDAQGIKYSATSFGNAAVTFNTSNTAIEFTVGGAVRFSLTQAGNIISQSLASSTSFANDSAAATGGVAIGQFYRSGSAVMIRVS